VNLKLYFLDVKILLEMSPEHCDRLLHGISERSSLYAVLKNGVVLHHTAGTAFRMIEMLCEKFHARMLLTLAEKLCPEAALRLKRESGSREHSTDGRVILASRVTRLIVKRNRHGSQGWVPGSAAPKARTCKP
jgi:hypothetical protein